MRRKSSSSEEEDHNTKESPRGQGELSLTNADVVNSFADVRHVLRVCFTVGVRLSRNWGMRIAALSACTICRLYSNNVNV